MPRKKLALILIPGSLPLYGAWYLYRRWRRRKDFYRILHAAGFQ